MCPYQPETSHHRPSHAEEGVVYWRAPKGGQLRGRNKENPQSAAYCESELTACCSLSPAKIMAIQKSTVIHLHMQSNTVKPCFYLINLYISISLLLSVIGQIYSRIRYIFFTFSLRSFPNLYGYTSSGL